MTLAEQKKTLQTRGLTIQNEADATQLLERVMQFMAKRLSFCHKTLSVLP